MSYAVFDFHCDTALKLLEQRRSLRRNDCHIDLTRAGEGHAQCFAMFTTPAFEQWYHRPVTEVFADMLSNLEGELAQNADVIAKAGSPAEIGANRSQGKLSAILTLEGPAGIGYDPARLEELYARGFRVSTLGWNEKNVLTGSNVTGGGLTELGREYVRECQRLGILVDVSHISDEGFWDILDITQAPVIASHSNLRSVWGHSRNLTEEMYLALVQTGGAVGINLFTEFVKGKDSTLDDVCDHILRMLELAPDGKHICLGGDLDGCESLPAGFDGVQSYQTLARRLKARGLDEGTVEDICWNNAMGVMNRAVRDHQK